MQPSAQGQPPPLWLCYYTVLIRFIFSLSLEEEDQALLVVLRVLRGVCAALEDVLIM